MPASHEQARLALAANRTYLAKVTDGTVTQADHAAQVARLTRQMQALIRTFITSDVPDDVEEV